MAPGYCIIITLTLHKLRSDLGADSMKTTQKAFLLAAMASAMLAVSFAAARAADDADADAVAAVIDLLGEKDKEMRALGLQQVREELKGAAATRQFVAALPKLPAEVQAELLAALGDRGDRAARPAVLDSLKNQEATIRLAALRALGPLGEAADVAVVVPRLTTGQPNERAATKKCLVAMCGETISPAIAAELKGTNPKLRVALIGVLTARRANGCADEVLAVAGDSDAEVRKAAVAALGLLAGPKQVPAMLACVLKAEPGAPREAAEKAVFLVCAKNKDSERRADPILSVWEKFSDSEKNQLLSTLGRVGGSAALKIIDSAIAGKDLDRRDAGIRALCNWPDATVVSRLLDLSQKPPEAKYGRLALRALTRVAVLPDKRSNAERLATLEKAVSLCTTPEERNYAIQRAKAIRTIESLRFVVPYLDKPEYAQSACSTVVELAHHRGLREPNKAEFNKALDAVLRLCKDADLLDRAERYKKGQTRLLPPPSGDSPGQ